MDTRNVTVTLDKAREWYNSGNATLREVALQVAIIIMATVAVIAIALSMCLDKLYFKWLIS